MWLLGLLCGFYDKTAGCYGRTAVARINIWLLRGCYGQLGVYYVVTRVYYVVSMTKQLVAMVEQLLLG